METLEEVNERQRQLLGGLSHEMKTPMTAIIGNAEMLLTLQLKDREREKALFHILNEARRLARLSEKMMEFSRLYEDLGSVIVMKRQKIGKVLEQLEALTAFRLAEKPVEITGPLKVELYASSDAIDTDFVCKVSVVHPNGKAYSIGSHLVRARFRNGEKAEFLDRKSVV